MDLLKKLEQLLGAKGLKTDKNDCEHYGKDWLDLYPSRAAAVALPKSTEEVSSVVKLCREHKHAIVPSGGRTGLSGGAAATEGEIVLSLERMNKLDAVNLVDRTLRAEAGVPTERIQQAAEEAELFYPIDFASKGSSHIGGNVATNAGGIRVIKYGLTKERVLGLTVVTGTGDILKLNGNLFKNQSGLDLRSLFIGSEGLLGIITEVTLHLLPSPPENTKIFCALNDVNAVPNILTKVRSNFRNVSMFEFLKRNALEKVIEEHGKKDPFQEAHEVYLLIEIEKESEKTQDNIEEVFGSLLEDELILDAVIGQSEQQNRELLSLREFITESLSAKHFVYKNDISVPVPTLPDFITKLETLVSEHYQAAELVLFGHIGDGNIHISILKPEAIEKDEFIKLCHDKENKLFELIQSFDGSISAEHGVGLLKRDSLHYTRSSEEVALMRGIKAVFDPDNILNPGKVFL